MSGGGNEIVLLVEGKTEKAVKPVLKRFLDERCEKNINALGQPKPKPKVRLTTKPLDSRLLKEKTVKDQLTMNLGRPSVRGVVALIDVVCSGRPQQFKDAGAAIQFLADMAPEEPRYRAHAAQYDFEAWLLPYWNDICLRLKIQKQPPGGNPEAVNRDHPPSRHLSKLYRLAKHKPDYDKPRDALAILTDKDLF